MSESGGSRTSTCNRYSEDLLIAATKVVASDLGAPEIRAQNRRTLVEMVGTEHDGFGISVFERHKAISEYSTDKAGEVEFAKDLVEFTIGPLKLTDQERSGLGLPEK